MQNTGTRSAKRLIMIIKRMNGRELQSIDGEWIQHQNNGGQNGKKQSK